MRLYRGDTKVRAFNVQKGKTFIAENISPGNYKLRYRIFLSGKFHVFEANDLFNVTQSTDEDGNPIRSTNVYVTLYKVTNGNMATKEIDPSRF